ncbi:NgrE [Xenorhabdus stockiae]|uniref:NgrE n=1 Tax=Xenorhabdus stockiae TaxID=351614 RepID=A0A2D0KW89_9GAMM|nr:hypothetical protein [Xenorhabdus stockiae]PHM67683.1 NgrE [Xenorhabdus stockiae]
MIYTQGTLSTVSGSAIVRGTGTKFKDNLNGIAPGQVLIIQSGSSNLLHMIQAVNSDTELVLADKAKTTLNNVTYQIQTTVPNSISDGVRHMVAINAYIVQFLQNMDKWMSQNGVVEVTLPNGQTVSLQSIKAMNEAIAGKLGKSQNGADIPDKNGFINNLGLRDTVNRASNAVVIDLSNGGVQKIKSALVIEDSVSAVGEIACRDGRSYLMMKTKDGGPHFAYTWDGVSWHNMQFPKGAGVALVVGANCWVAEGGFIKVASPIIEIFPSGKFTTNDESEGATVSKPGLGHYQVAGVLGYNADGAWGVHGGISSPKNNNGLELIYIDDKVNKDGSITIETFHRQHSHLPARFQNKRIKALVNGEKVYYQDGEPCDIPEGCRLDVRVQMPANSVWNVKQKAAEVATDSDQTETVE